MKWLFVTIGLVWMLDAPLVQAASDTLELTIDPIPATSKMALQDGAVQDEQYFYDTIGNLTGRTDHAIDLVETFDYDALNRLTGSQLAGRGADLYQFAGVDVTTYDYDALGNLVYRSDVGSGSVSVAEIQLLWHYAAD